MKITRILFLLALILHNGLLFTSCGDPAVRYYNLGLEAAERDDLDGAIENWLLALKRGPGDAETHYNLGLAYLKKGMYKDAEKHFLKAAAFNPEDHEIQWGLGKAYEMRNELVKAKKAYEYSISIRGIYYPPYLGLASCALKQDQSRTAEKYATQALRLDTRNLEGNLLLAEAYFRQSNYQEAYAQLLSIRSYYSDNPDLLLLLGKVMSARLMHKDALATLKAARAVGVSNVELFLYLGKSSFALQYYDEAREYFKLSIFKNPNEIEARIGLAETYYELDELDKSLDSWRRAGEIDSSNPLIDLGISKIHLRKYQFEEALPLLEALAVNPDAPARTLYYLGHTRMRLGQKTEAKRAFETFIKQWKGDPQLIEEVKELMITL
ncbi:MAG: tetratricopeptide repeat protein [Candidatus Krumholzibacteriota bacterium]|nr:tetratricopeptide repeat protein [Candidatus Krumholzibacteriota bacterium]